MPTLGSLKPKFWDHRGVTGPYRDEFNFRRIWQVTIGIILLVALVPLFLIAIIEHTVTKDSTEAVIRLRTSQTTSNAWRTVSFFLSEHTAALTFIVEDNSYEELTDEQHLTALLDALTQSFGGFVDIGVIDASGVQVMYVGPHKLQGANYHDQEWFQEVLESGVYISDVFLGFRNVPHLVIAIKHRFEDGSFFVLRATIDTEQFYALLSNLEVWEHSDAFIINSEGILQTPSRFHGDVFDQVEFSIPEYSEGTNVLETHDRSGRQVLAGYAHIPGTPFTLMLVKQKHELMGPWYNDQLKLLGLIVVSTTVIILVVLFVATFLINQLFSADQKRLMTLRKVEYTNKMASIGRLAAGVAHEINNPLAIINEKAGLLTDLFLIEERYVRDEKLLDLAVGIIRSVERCATITRRLLNFSRRTDMRIQPINLEEVANEVLGFLGKEADHRMLTITVNAPDDLPMVQSDRGKLQEIFLNLVNNALAAIGEGGKLDVSIETKDDGWVSIAFSDDGCGIPKKDLEHVFEPFFTTRTNLGGTGLGLSITYTLTKKIGGTISVQSRENEGTTFTVTLPVLWWEGTESGESDERAAGG